MFFTSPTPATSARIRASARLSRLTRDPRQASASGFTLLELLVSVTIFMAIMVMGFAILDQASNVWRSTVDKARVFQAARLSFDLLTRNLEQATLHTRLEYLDSLNRFPSDTGYNGTPQRYGRRSELQLVCAQAGTDGIPGTPGTGSAIFFTAPLGYTGTSDSYTGLDQLLSVCGYYIEFGVENSVPAHAAALPSAKPIYRYRLKQLLVPSQNVAIFQPGAETSFAWFKTPAATQGYTIAENVIALVVRPRYPNPTTAQPDLVETVYSYDSRLNERGNPQPVTANQLPPTVLITLVAIDEAAAKRLENGATQPTAIQTALSGKFTAAANFDSDLSQLKTALDTARIRYQVISGTITLKESQWTR